MPHDPLDTPVTFRDLLAIAKRGGFMSSFVWMQESIHQQARIAAKRPAIMATTRPEVHGWHNASSTETTERDADG